MAPPFVPRDPVTLDDRDICPDYLAKLPGIWQMALLMFGVLILVAWGRGELNGATFYCSSWAGAFGFTLGMWAQLAIQRKFK